MEPRASASSVIKGAHVVQNITGVNQAARNYYILPASKTVTWPVMKSIVYCPHSKMFQWQRLHMEIKETRNWPLDYPTNLLNNNLCRQRSVLKNLLPPQECIQEPPLTKQFSAEQVNMITEELFVARIPCHSQGAGCCWLHKSNT